MGCRFLIYENVRCRERSRNNLKISFNLEKLTKHVVILETFFSYKILTEHPSIVCYIISHSLSFIFSILRVFFFHWISLSLSQLTRKAQKCLFSTFSMSSTVIQRVKFNGTVSALSRIDTARLICISALSHWWSSNELSSNDRERTKKNKETIWLE